MNLEEFRAYAKVSNVIPVSRKLLADSETPLGVYKKLAKSAANTFLLESAEHGGAWSRYSFIGVRSEATLSEKDGLAYWQVFYYCKNAVETINLLRLLWTRVMSSNLGTKRGIGMASLLRDAYGLIVMTVCSL